MPMGPGMMGRHPMAGQLMRGEMAGPMQGHMMQMQMMQMMGPMMQGMAFAPDHLLARKDALELTPQQVTRLTALRDAARQAHDAAAAEAKTHMGEMATAMNAAKPDTTQMKTHFQAAQAAMGRAHWAMLSAAAQARGTLSDLQRGRVEGWSQGMQERMMSRMHRRGAMRGMPGGMMMQHGDSTRPH
jgi:hypothetical protein